MNTKYTMAIKTPLEKKEAPLNGQAMDKNIVNYQTISQYKELISRSPSREWVKTNPFSQNAKYLPIRVIEQLLYKVFPFWQAEQNGETKIIGNSIIVEVTLKVYHPVLKDWLSYPGIGAVPIEVEKGAHPVDFAKIKPKALHKNAPAALSFAINNAAKKIGRLFGAHLNSNQNEIL